MSKLLKCAILCAIIGIGYAYPVYDTVTFNQIDNNMNNNFTVPGDIMYCNLTGGPNHDRQYTTTFVISDVQNILKGVTVCVEGGPDGQNGYNEFDNLANKSCGMYPGDLTGYSTTGWTVYASQMGGDDWGVESGSCAANPIGDK